MSIRWARPSQPKWFSSLVTTCSSVTPCNGSFDFSLLMIQAPSFVCADYTAETCAPQQSRQEAKQVKLADIQASISYSRCWNWTAGDLGATTEVAALLAFLLGALAVHGLYLEAATAAVVTAVLLGSKERLHALLRNLSRLELNASLQLLVIVLVVLPLLPNQSMGPWDSINPQVIGWLVILIAGISFAGYFAVRLLGDRVGLVLTALLGGLASSTALTLAFSRMARVDSSRSALLGAGIALACGTMAVRLLIEVAVVNRALVMPLLPCVMALA